MKVPLSWLKEYVPLEAPVADIVEKLTFSGIEVEGVETVGEGLDQVVAARVLAVEKHPNADRLQICRVFDGSGELQVVCGAPNVAEGQVAALAPVGCVLPGGLKIKKAKVRGTVSEGMLCAEDELGLSEDHAGILGLPEDMPPGEPLSTLYGDVDTVLELEITWNRPDCLSVVGVARELAALYGLPLQQPGGEPSQPEGAVADAITVDVRDPEGCCRYTAGLLRGVSVGPSPLWMQRRLQLSGVRPINAIVDVTNYVMLELGQPLHAFDYDLVRGQRIEVRRATPGEVLTTLDGEQRKLDEGILVIADGEGPVAVAGVMGGIGSEIGPATSNVLIESACFDPRLIRSASVRLGLRSESSHRFERGVDAVASAAAGKRAAMLMQQMVGGVPAAGLVDVAAMPAQPRIIPLRGARVQQILGVTVPEARMQQIFTSLGFSWQDGGDATYAITVPSFRPDITREADLLEEIARMYGLEHIPEAVPAARVVPTSDDAPARAMARCHEVLAGFGVSEAMHYSFLPAALLDAFTPSDREQRVVLPNPVSEDQGVLRISLIPQLVESLARNHARQIDAAALYEIGTVFFRDTAGQPSEEKRVGIGLMGSLPLPGIQERGHREPADVYFMLKGILEQVVGALHGRELSFRPEFHPYCEQGMAAAVLLAGHPIGYIGLLRKELCKRRRLTEPVAVAECRFAPLSANCFAPRSFVPIPSYPAVSRDVAAVVSEDVTHEQLMRIIARHAPAELTDISLFDIFRGGDIVKGKKSVGYSLTYRSATQTLTDEETNALHEKVRNALQEEVGAEFRA